MGVNCSGGRMAGLRCPRKRRGGMDGMTDSDGDEWVTDGKETIELGPALAVLGGVGGRT